MPNAQWTNWRGELVANSIDPAYGRLLALEPEIAAALKVRANESDTRLRILDRFLFEILEWKRDSVLTEPSVTSGYIDYLLTVGDQHNAMVIEAKRNGLLTPSTKGEEVISVALSGPVVKPLQAGIRQALTYAMDTGVAAAAVTDGNTWLFFKASRTDGKPPLSGRGILFPNFTSILNNFAKFVELLNVGSIVSRLHLAHLNEAEGLIITDAEQQYYVLDPREARMRLRDPLASDAALLFSQFFSRLSNEKDREMLRDCFVETGESRRADFELEKIIQRVLNTITPLNTGQGNALQLELERAMHTGRSETVLLIGNKGAGKSTFIDRFFEQVLPLRLREKCVVARVDLEEYHGDPNGIVPWVILRLRESLETGICASHPPSYDELQGIFFSEYQRWSLGSRKYLYDSNKTEFKDQFGQHIEGRRESQPDEYVRLLLAWSSSGHNKLPCLIFDNTDQFSADVQDKVYQMAHSFESAAPLFNVVPITDRTVWRLSKAGALQSYSAHSFYLPVPEVKEIISRRVDFLKSKLQAEPKAAQSYFSKLGFRVEVNDLAVLADAVGKVFVEDDYVSGLIGRLGNFDIRRMLKITERIFLSPEMKIDDIIKSRFGGESVVANPYRAHRALIRGEYDRFTETENEFISNLFQTEPRRPGPPLFSFHILWMLRQKLHSVRLSDDDVEKRHWSVMELCQFFEACGVSEDITINTLNRLYNRRLVEALDPNAEQVGISDKVAIKESGIAHMELVLNSPVYIEQMALVTGLTEIPTRDEIRKNLQESRMAGTRDPFLRYIIKIDSGRLGIPTNANYAQLSASRNQVASLIASRERRIRPAPPQRMVS